MHPAEGAAMNAIANGSRRGSPVLAVASSLAAGLVLAFVLVFGPAARGSESTITGSVLVAFGLGWALMAFLTTHFSAQPQGWMNVPAAFLGFIGLGLIVLQPGPAAMDLLSWPWPPALAVLAIWMTREMRRNLRVRARWLVVPTIAILMAFAIGGGLETFTTATSAAGAAAGQLVDVGGHRLFISCAGSGGPTLVLESGLAESSAYWGWISPRVAATTRVCVYDRAGRGRSDSVSGPIDPAAAARDLHTLLERSGNAGPYVLVGHSSGAVYVRIFAVSYPTEVVGMVTLDGQPADALTALPWFPTFYDSFRSNSALLPSVARLGILRLGQLGAADLPPAAQAAESLDQSSPGTMASARDEFAMLPTAFREALTLTTLGSMPLMVLEAASGEEVGWDDAQVRMAALSTNSVHRVLAGATHTSLIFTETDSQAAATAILDVVAAVRTGTPLSGSLAIGPAR
jgi:pimeloyl-ACP methyl ester carboxylesterase